MIKVQNIHKSYGEQHNRFEVLRGVTFGIKDEDFVVLLGASGSGKSTLLNIISGLEAPDEGLVLYDDVDIAMLSESQRTKFRRDNIGYVFQQYYLLPNFNIDKNVKMGAELSGNKDYIKMIEAVGLGEKQKKYPHELSGGEQQRASVARALAKKPKVLFMDEPTGALDEATGRLVLDYIVKLQKELNFTIIMVTHNTNIAEMARIVIKMNSGKIVDQYENAVQKTAYEIGW